MPEDRFLGRAFVKRPDALNHPGPMAVVFGGGPKDDYKGWPLELVWIVDTRKGGSPEHQEAVMRPDHWLTVESFCWAHNSWGFDPVSYRQDRAMSRERLAEWLDGKSREIPLEEYFRARKDRLLSRLEFLESAFGPGDRVGRSVVEPV